MKRGHGQAAPLEAASLDGLLSAVADVARAAGDVALSYFDQARRSALAIEIKADGSPVTAADRAAESTAREWIERRFPADGIVGEELGVVRPAATRRWFIDPIDGTKSFVRGVPLWGTLIAVAEGEAVLAGPSVARRRVSWSLRRSDAVLGGTACVAASPRKRGSSTRPSWQPKPWRRPARRLRSGAGRLRDARRDRHAPEHRQAQPRHPTSPFVSRPGANWPSALVWLGRGATPTAICSSPPAARR